ncbi:MAG: helix-turn-helix transcriptional regulator [Lachnospiraceae bacterium]|nr:helix-turn-helix transcriptional regulator [Lachnospiraceae bacterium]
MKDNQSINRIIQVNDINIGANIATLRKSLKIKQTEMVARLQVMDMDISTFTYNRIEKGTQNPTVSFLFAICDILHCDMNTLFCTKK